MLAMVYLHEYVLDPTWINPAQIEFIEQSTEDVHVWIARMVSGKMVKVSEAELAHITGQNAAE
ncbi:hypothetical protein FC91_GL003004 [Schleiferilactobacillus harbinensis DSM 16991]|uniref:Uncharacterized protein n=2 Tax=Schleiferilactobacillus harbinensis TaxID=304207 RepID=A0A0R1XDD7_9LACO|nr:hypothetical protein FC91_GL003004 [Schleiferilactobacillus harbinensis DSM 16991]